MKSCIFLVLLLTSCGPSERSVDDNGTTLLERSDRVADVPSGPADCGCEAPPSGPKERIIESLAPQGNHEKLIFNTMD